MAQSSPVIALLSIKPVYANAILAGRKKVEFRKRPFKRPVSHIVIYATSPVQRVIGWFKTKHTDLMSPSALWRQFSNVGGINESDFYTYYGDAVSGVAIHVHQPKRLTKPLPLGRTSCKAAPQSYAYLSPVVFDRLTGNEKKLPPKRHAARKKKK